MGPLWKRRAFFGRKKDSFMANLNVTYEELTTQASNLKAGEEELMSTLNRLQGQVNQLMSVGFQTDKASGAFGTSYEQFTKGAKETISGLEGMASFLRKAQQSMSEMDSSLASSLQS